MMDQTVNNTANHDSIQHNESGDLANVVASHYNKLEEKGLSERNKSRILYMRNFNNWIKSMLINEYMDKIKQNKPHNYKITVLDMCCGKGGDLLKWQKAQISHLICADIAEISVQQCETRYREKQHQHKFKAEFMACDCTKVRLRERYKDASTQLDLVSCQFSFHYCFESLSQAECMIKNASETLKPGGFFIGTIPNAYELVSRWQKVEGNKFGNDLYEIEFLCDKKNPPLFGAKYNFNLDEVVNCPEFLVHPPTFIKLANKFGLEIVMFENFENFFHKMKDNGKFLLKKMQGLSMYQSKDDTKFSEESPDEYKHVIEFLTKNSNDNREIKLGTLSRSEWEAVTLYSVFAFKKKKTIWNAEGKPEFV